MHPASRRHVPPAATRRRPEAIAILAIGLACVSALVLARYLLGL